MTVDWTRKIRLRHLEAVLSLARTLNVTHTATELNTHQSGLSKLLKDLEGDIGVELFDRRGRSLVMNDNGRAAHFHASRIKSAIEAFRDEMTVLARQGSGLLSVGIVGASSIDALPTAVLSLLKKRPKIHIRVLEGSAKFLQEKLIDNEIDIILGQSGLSFEAAHCILDETLYSDEICVVARYGHPLAARQAISWDEVISYQLAVWSNGTPIRRALDNALLEKEWTFPANYIESNSSSVNLNLILNSDIIGFSMKRAARAYEKLNVLSILPIELASAGAVSMYWRSVEGGRDIMVDALHVMRLIAATV